MVSRGWLLIEAMRVIFVDVSLVDFLPLQPTLGLGSGFGKKRLNIRFQRRVFLGFIHTSIIRGFCPQVNQKIEKGETNEYNSV